MSNHVMDLCSSMSGEPDFDEAARRVMAELGCPAKWSAVFFPLVRAECRRQYRGATLAMERSGSTGQPIADTHTGSAGRASDRQALLDRSFALGDGRLVSWGAATVEDHRQRVAFLASMRNGINSTITEHEDAISAIEAAGVTCLSQIAMAA